MTVVVAGSVSAANPMRQNPHPTESGGFALIVTLTLLVMLTLLAVGLLSLSAVTIRAALSGVK